MPRAKPIQMNFTAGEWSPLLAGRVDLEKYYNAADTLENFIILPHGGIQRRGGFHYAGAAKNANKKCRLIPFEFSTTQAYILEFGDLYIRVWMNHGQVVSVPSTMKLLLHGDGVDASTTITDSGYTGHTVTAMGNVKLRTDDYVFGTASIYFPGASGDYIYAADHADFDVSSGTFTFDCRIKTEAKAVKTIFYQDDGTTNNYIKLWIEGGSSPLYNGFLRFKIVASGVTVVELTGTRTVIANDTWYHVGVVENGNSWYLLVDGAVETSATDTDRAANYTSNFVIGCGPGAGGSDHFKGRMDEVSFSNGVAAWTAAYTPPSTEYPLGGASAVEIVSPYKESELSGIKFVQSADTLYLVHPNYQPRTLTRSSHVSWTLATISFTAMPDWSDGKGWPEAVSFYEDRLIFAGSATYPQTIWASKSGDYDNFTTGTADDEAFVYTISSNKVNRIRWLSPSRVLLIGTVGGEFRMVGGSESFVSPTNVDIKSETSYGSANIQGVQIGNACLMVQRSGKQLRELTYNYETDSYVAPDLTILSEHLTENGITELAWQQEPHRILWALRSDGVLLGMTYMRDQDIVGWHPHTTDGLFESIAVVPSADGKTDELYAVVNRTIGGSTVRYIEYLDPDIFVDSGMTYSGAEVSSISGLNHLEGEEVDIIGDGAVYATDTVSSGAIALSPAASEIYAGLPFSSTAVTMRPEIQAGGTSQGSQKKWAKVWVRLYDSVGCKVNDEQIPFRSSGDAMDESIDHFTGDYYITSLGWDTDGQLTIEQEQSLPLTVLAVFGVLEVGE